MLGDLQPKFTVTYNNDIIIFSFLIEQHIVDVKAILEQLNNVNLKMIL